MSWRVRRFLKQVREQKEEEKVIEKEVASKSIENNDCSTITNSCSDICTDRSPSCQGRYVNWMSRHTDLATQPWCCISDLIHFCDKYEYQSFGLSDTSTINNIVAEVKALLSVGQAPFDIRKRFPGNIHNPENLWICIGSCPGVEYHLKKILSVFRKPLVPLPADKLRVARQNFHMAVAQLRLDISARISAVNLYDRNIFESEYHLHWEDEAE
ncbi:uncharacterized protein LOC101462166 [Ceratitis capitata]|uniref:(Mediterranean fruit fly) hypothetical protein n=1 Tax=Ceratitis capitata TaxID=7213 RepID=A0A811UL66_CERCA|nr:uncharacterized protein LOC101462166 [Ceratitis capitata]CAD6998475.1 unnamed protein product [Ceratitis capitata]